MRQEEFGVTPTGEKVKKFTLTNDAGMEVDLTDFGACILAVRVPGSHGNLIDVVLGYDTLEEYFQNAPGFGAYVGRNCNRIQDAWVKIAGVTYLLEANNHGHNLHSGSDRSHYKVYSTVSGKNDEGEYVELRRLSPHLEQGYPGNLKQLIRYTLSENNELIIDYEMESDKDTVINPTNHSYFNLQGHNSGSVRSHILEIYTNKFLPTDPELIPTGEVATVDGTPMDFTRPKSVGKDIEAEYTPIQIGSGYDHNYVFPNDGLLRPVARLHCLESGIVMDVSSDCCGLQVYSGNFLDGVKGKDNAVYEKYAGICFETQNYPNACKTPGFPTSIVAANKKFQSRSIYKFTVMDN